jgi:RNA polymerase nonessential primary-like sigma factor
LAGDGELPEERLDGECLKGDLRALLEQLPELQGRVLKMRYGISCNDAVGLVEPMSLSSIAKALGMSRDKTRNLERKAIEGVRARSPMLEGYMVA